MKLFSEIIFYYVKIIVINVFYKIKKGLLKLSVCRSRVVEMKFVKIECV